MIGGGGELIIFGGCGYVGRAFVREALARGCKARVCDLDDRHVPEGASVMNFAGIADINQAREMPHAVVEVNIIGNLNILEACRKKGVRKYGFASSAYVYSLHGSFYRISKRTCEEYILEYSRRYKVPYVIYRYGSLYGGDSDSTNGVHRMVTSALVDGVVRYGGGQNDSREYIHVGDAARISVDLLLGDTVNQAYLLTGSERITIAQFFEMLSEILDRPLKYEYDTSGADSHYRMTQYNFAPIEAKKIHLNEHIDIGNGLLDLIQRMYSARLDGEHAEQLIAPIETLV